MSDYQKVSIACFAALFLLVFVPIWIGKAIDRGREMPAPPETLPDRKPCAAWHCPLEGTMPYTTADGRTVHYCPGDYDVAIWRGWIA